MKFDLITIYVNVKAFPNLGTPSFSQVLRIFILVSYSFLSRSCLPAPLPPVPYYQNQLLYRVVF